MDYFKGVNDANEGLLRALDAYRNNIYERPARELKYNEALRRRKTLADIQKIQKLEDKPSLSGDAAEGGLQTAEPSLFAKAPAVTPALRGDEVFTTDPGLAPATGNLGPVALNEALAPMVSGRAAPSSAEMPASPQQFLPEKASLALGAPPSATPRPAGKYSQQEKTQMMVQAALKNGDWETLGQIAKVTDLTDKINRHDAEQLSWWASQVQNFKKTTGNSAAATGYGKQLAQQMGIDPSLVNSIDFTTQNDIVTPDGKGGHILMKADNDGKQHYFHIKEPDHAPIEIPRPDGKTAQKFMYNRDTQRYDLPIGEPYAVKSQVPNISVTNQSPSETAVGVGNNGMMVFKNRRGGPPFFYNEQGNKVMYTGQINPKSTAPALGEGATAAQISSYASDRGAEAKTKKDIVAFRGFEQGMLKNADYALTISKQYPRSEFPSVNTVMNAINRGTGDPKVIKFANAVYAAAIEYQKIKTAGTGITSAELSITAQKKAEEMMGSSLTHEQLKGTVEVMKVDARNIISSRQAELGILKDEIRNRKNNAGKSSVKVGRFTVERE